MSEDCSSLAPRPSLLPLLLLPIAAALPPPCCLAAPFHTLHCYSPALSARVRSGAVAKLHRTRSSSRLAPVRRSAPRGGDDPQRSRQKERQGGDTPHRRTAEERRRRARHATVSGRTGTTMATTRVASGGWRGSTTRRCEAYRRTTLLCTCQPGHCHQVLQSRTGAPANVASLRRGARRRQLLTSEKLVRRLPCHRAPPTVVGGGTRHGLDAALNAVQARPHSAVPLARRAIGLTDPV